MKSSFRNPSLKEVFMMSYLPVFGFNTPPRMINRFFKWLLISPRAPELYRSNPGSSLMISTILFTSSFSILPATTISPAASSFSYFLNNSSRNFFTEAGVLIVFSVKDTVISPCNVNPNQSR